MCIRGKMTNIISCYYVRNELKKYAHLGEKFVLYVLNVCNL